MPAPAAPPATAPGPGTAAAGRQAAAVLAGILLAVILNVCVRYEPYTFIRRDGSFYATITMGLVKNFSLDQRLVQPQSWYSGEHPAYANMDMGWSNISVGRGGAWYPKHSFLVSVAAAPFFVLLGVVGFLVFNAACVVAMMWAAYLLAARFAAPTAAAIAALLTTLSPMMAEHTYHLSADVFNAALIALGTLALVGGRPATAGALLGLALWARPVTALLVVPVAAALLWRSTDRRQLRRLVVAAAVPLGAAALANIIMFGAPWITSYDRILWIQNHAQRIGSHRAHFTNGLSEGWHLMFANREHGLVANALPSLVALAGLVPLFRRHRLLAAALAAGTAGMVAFYVLYRFFNARFFLAWEVLVCLPLAVLLDEAAVLGLRAAPPLRALAVRARARVQALPRWAPAVAALVLVVGLGAARLIAGRSYVLSAHVTDAKVFRNDFPCDYFNFTHQAWECSRLDRGADELAGLAIRPEACRMDGAAWRALTLAPPAEGGTRRIRWERLPPGALDLDYGLRAGSGAAETCFRLSYGGRPAERVCAAGAGQRHHRRFEPPAGDAPRTLEIAVDGRGPRELCFDGVVR